MAHHRCRILSNRLALTSSGNSAIIRPKRMELTDPYTGLRRSRDKKTGASRGRNGSMLPDISETGKIIKKTASVFTSIKMEISMRVSGKETSVTAKAPTGEMKLENFVVSTQGTGAKIRNMAEAHSFTRMAIDTMATGLPGCLKAKAE